MAPEGDRPSVEVSPSGNERNLVNTRTSKPALTIGRIVGLVAIGLLVLGLGYLHFGTGDDPVSVPSAAHAGQVILEPCHYATENGSYAADCGTLVVPERRADPRSRLIALPVTRIRARSAQPGSSRLPARGRARHHQHGVLEGEPDCRQPRRRAAWLPRHRRLRAARLPGGRVGAQALDRLPHGEVATRVRRRVPGLRRRA